MLFKPVLLSSLAGSLAAAATATSSAPETYTTTVTFAYGGTSVINWRDDPQPTMDNVGDVNLVPSHNSTEYQPQEECPGYAAEDVHESDKGVKAKLKLAGDKCNTFGVDIGELDLSVEYQEDNRLSVKIQPSHITPANESYYLVPPELLPQGQSKEKTKEGSDFEFKYSNSPSFWFEVVRKSTGESVFSTKGSKLVFENQFIELKTQLPEDHNIFGLGESLDSFRLPPGSLKTLFNADIGDIPKANIYGSHPFYVEERFDGDAINSHGVYLRNVHAQEVSIGETSLTWRAIGGSLELYFFSGPSAKDVAKQYQEVVGLPSMHQYWTLGYHHCRYGFHNISEVHDVVKNYRAFGIPLETIWTDIDYMNQRRDFTLDANTFPQEEFEKFLDEVHANDQHYIPMLDAAIYHPNPKNESDAYPPFDRGNEKNVFLKNPDGSTYIGAVWPGYTVFPDWLAENTTEWWTDEVAKFYDILKFDGIWIDMNEASSFCIGSCGSGKIDQNPFNPFPSSENNFVYPKGFKQTNESEWKIASAKSSSSAAAQTKPPPTPSPSVLHDVREDRNVNYPPYAINNWKSPNPLGVSAISPNATHHNGMLEYDIHNLYGYHNGIATYEALSKLEPEKRPFIISRSTFSGAGHYVGHWGGDNYADWEYMKYSIPQGLSFSLFGIPMFGVDTCGFSDNTDMELCTRWSQLSAFFSFYRNHNAKDMDSQEFYLWESVTKAAKKAMHIRYSLLPYYYTLLEKAHEDGDTFLRALSWEFPEKGLTGIDTQFLVGPSLLVTPVLEPLVDTVDGVFPGQSQVWYDWYNQSKVDAPANENVTIDAPLGHIPLYIRGGSILPTQEPGYTIKESREGDWGLIVALDKDNRASGDVYIDDGESVSSKSTWVRFDACGNTLTVKNDCGDYKVGQPLTKISILGVEKKPKQVRLDNRHIKSTYDAKTQVLEISLKSDCWASKGLKLEW